LVGSIEGLLGHLVHDSGLGLGLGPERKWIEVVESIH